MNFVVKKVFPAQRTHPPAMPRGATGRKSRKAPSNPVASRRAESGPSHPTRRGRPRKFGRPSQVVALTLPADVLGALRSIHADPGWAIVQLVERILKAGASARRLPRPAALAELVYVPGRRALIVVQPDVCRRLRGVSTIPLADGRAFLALDEGAGLADLEVAILDRLEAPPAHGAARSRLRQLLQLVRAWRRDSGLRFRTRSIIVAEDLGSAEARPLTSLARGRRSRTKTA